MKIKQETAKKMAERVKKILVGMMFEMEMVDGAEGFKWFG